MDQFSLLENALSSSAGGSCYDPSSSSSLYYSQAALSGLGGSHGNLQDPSHMRANMLYANCSGGLPNIILTGESDTKQMRKGLKEEMCVPSGGNPYMGAGCFLLLLKIIE